MTTKRRRTRRQQPFMLLVMLLYGTHASVTWGAPLSCVIKTNHFAKSLGVTSCRVRRHLTWLYDYGYLTALRITHGNITATVRTPVHAFKEPTS